MDKQAWKKDYLAQKKILTYKDYVAESGSAEALRQSNTRADTAYAKARASYGSRASSLLARGLTGSGYSDYLDGAAYAEKTRAKEEAARLKEERDRTGYAAYLSAAEKEAETAYEEKEAATASAFTKLLSQKITDKDAAFSYLTALGVDEESARLLSEKNDAILHASSERRSAILNYSLEKMFRFERAYSYALANGLTEAQAKEIASISQAARDAIFGNDSTYKFDISKYQEFLNKN